MSGRLVLREKRIPPMNGSLKSHHSCGRTRHGDRRRIGSCAQALSVSNFAQRLCSPDGHSDGAGVYSASRADVMFFGDGGDCLGIDPSRTVDSVPGTSSLAEGRLQRTAASRNAADGIRHRKISVHRRRHHVFSGEKEDVQHVQHVQHGQHG